MKNEHRQATEAGLDLLRVLGWMVLHDVSVADDPSIIVDHVAAGPSGVYVINTVPVSGAVAIRDDSVLVGGVAQRAELAAVAAAAAAIRELTGGRPVAPLLCFASGEELAGLVGGVAVCSTENVLDVLTAQATRLDAVSQAAVSRALRAGLTAATSPRALPDEEVPAAVAAPKRHRTGLRFKKGRAEDESPAAAPEAPKPVAVVPTTPDAEQKPESTPAVEPVVEAVVEPVIEPVVESVVEPVVVVAAETLTLTPSEAPSEAPSVDESNDSAGPRHAAPAAPTRPTLVGPPVTPKRRAAAPAAANVRSVPVEEVAEPVAERHVVAAPVAPKRVAEMEPVALEPVAEPDAPVVENLLETEVEVAADVAVESVPEVEAVVEAPVVEAPVVQAPVVEAPVVEATVVEAPVVEAPVVVAPVVVAPVVQEPTGPDAAILAELAAQRSEIADERARLVADRERAQTELREATERRRQAALEEQRNIAEERRVAASERARAEDEHLAVLAEQERIAADQERIAAERKRVAEERRRAEKAQARAVEERKRAVAERKAAEVAQARAEQERIAADRRAADRAQRERHVVELVAADLAAQGSDAAEAAAAVAISAAAAAGLPARFAAPPHAFAPDLAEKAAPARAHRTVGLGGFKVVAISAILVALVAGVAPRVPALINWGKTLIGVATPSATFGGQLSLGANTYHPDVRMVAGTPGVRGISGGNVPRGTSAVAVPLQIANAGSSRWVLPLGAELIAVDSLGMEHAMLRGVTGVKGTKALATSVKIRGGGIVIGSAVFAIPNGRIITKVRLALSSDTHDQPVWTN